MTWEQQTNERTRNDKCVETYTLLLFTIWTKYAFLFRHRRTMPLTLNAENTGQHWSLWCEMNEQPKKKIKKLNENSFIFRTTITLVSVASLCICVLLQLSTSSKHFLFHSLCKILRMPYAISQSTDETNSGFIRFGISSTHTATHTGVITMIIIITSTSNECACVCVWIENINNLIQLYYDTWHPYICLFDQPNLVLSIRIRYSMRLCVLRLSK